MSTDVIALFIPFGVFAMVVMIVWLATREKMVRARARTEVQKDLINKFGSGGELAEFLGSEGSRRLLEELGEPKLSAQEKVIRSVKVGVVLSVVGVGFLALMIQESDLMIPGIILLALGVGFLLAAAISYSLSKKMGLIDEATPAAERPSIPPA